MLLRPYVFDETWEDTKIIRRIFEKDLRPHNNLYKYLYINML